MKWNEIRIKTSEEACDAVSYMLTSIGAEVAIEDQLTPKKEILSPIHWTMPMKSL